MSRPLHTSTNKEKLLNDALIVSKEKGKKRKRKELSARGVPRGPKLQVRKHLNSRARFHEYDHEKHLK